MGIHQHSAEVPMGKCFTLHKHKHATLSTFMGIFLDTESFKRVCGFFSFLFGFFEYPAPELNVGLDVRKMIPFSVEL